MIYRAAGPLVMFDLIIPFAAVNIALEAPLGVQEMVFAVWLLIRGFDPSAIASLTAWREAPGVPVQVGG